mgnify:CR=1 FL=1
MNTFEITARDSGGAFAHNKHRIVLKEENDTNFIGWPDPTDNRNSEHWKPGIDKPLQYPKFAWKRVNAF